MLYGSGTRDHQLLTLIDLGAIRSTPAKMIHIESAGVVGTSGTAINHNCINMMSEIAGY